MIDEGTWQVLPYSGYEIWTAPVYDHALSPDPLGYALLVFHALEDIDAEGLPVQRPQYDSLAEAVQAGRELIDAATSGGA